MKPIKGIVRHIRNEIADAEAYAMDSAKLRDDGEGASKLYADLAHDELRHIDMLHDEAARMIDEYRSNGAEVPPSMQAVWDWEHDGMVESVARIKALLES